MCKNNVEKVSMTGYLIGLDTKLKKALIQQAYNKRIFAFSLDVWEGDFRDIVPNLEVEFKLSDSKEVISVKPKTIEKIDYTIRQTKSIRDCVYDFFGGVENLMQTYKKDINSGKNLDFLRIKRFLLTAYNDLFELDSTISNTTLTTLKSELLKLDREYENFSRKSSHPPQYSYEKIFLSKQIEYIKNEEAISSTKSIIASGSLQQASMASTLKNMEEQFATRRDKGSAGYLHAQKNLKHFRKRYVDLLHYLQQQKEKLEKITQAGKDFEEKYYDEFLRSYIPLIAELKSDFIKLLNSKAYDLDTLLWQRAKKSLSIRRFFIEAGITGTYSSKTFLKYFLRSLDESKIRHETKELFELLKYLETFSKKNILLIQQDLDDSKRYVEYLEHFDKDLNIITSNNPKTSFSFFKSTNFNIVVMEWEVYGIKATEYFQLCTKLQKLEGRESAFFCVITSKKISDKEIKEAKECGVQYFIPNNNIDQFIDMMRMIL